MDLEAIKRKLNSLKNQTTKQDILWKPEPGKQQVRIVPYQHNKENPFMELFFHYDLGKKNYLSPVTFGDADPVMEFAEKLKSTGNSDDWKLSRKLEPKMRTYVPVLVRGKESEGVKFWGFGKKVYTELLGFISDPDYGDITDTDTGTDLVLQYGKAPGAMFPSTSLTPKRKASPACKDEDNDCSGLLEEIPDFDGLFERKTTEDVQKLLDQYMSAGEDKEEITKFVAETGGDKVSKAFNELLSE